MVFKKRGQVTIWIILAFIAVAAIVLFFLFARGNQRGNIGESQTFDVEDFLEGCIESSIEDISNEILPRGGFLNTSNSKIWNDMNVSYLCQNIGYYKPCVNQRPQYLNEVRGEILRLLSPEIDACLGELKTAISENKGEFSYGELEIFLDLAPNRAYVDLVGEIKVTKDGVTDRYEELGFEIINPSYNLIHVAIEIASQEAKYCYFEYVGYQIIHPEFKIEKNTLSDSTKIYSIEDKKSGKTLNIAIRSCAIPPGF